MNTMLIFSIISVRQAPFVVPTVLFIWILVKSDGAFWSWGPNAYADAAREDLGYDDMVEVLTPPTAVAVLRAGYRAQVGR